MAHWWALAGGGAKGAAQVGMMLEMYDMGFRPEGISCTSVGAVNGGGYGVYKNPYQIEEDWMVLTTDKIIKPWFFGYLTGFFKGGLYNAAPLRKFLEKRITHETLSKSPIPIRFGCINVTSGEAEVGTEKAPRPVDWIMRSTVTPLAMPPEVCGDRVYSDHGLRNISPVGLAIRSGATSVSCLTPQPVNNLAKYDNNLRLDKLGGRYLSIILDEVHRNDIKMCNMYNTMVVHGLEEAKDKRYIPLEVLQPQDPLPIGSLEFEIEPIKKCIKIGREVAKRHFNP